MQRRTEYLWFWEWVPFLMPVRKDPDESDYRYVTTSTVETFARANPRVKVLHLDGCRQLSADAFAAIGTSCSGLVQLSAKSCDLKGTW